MKPIAGVICDFGGVLTTPLVEAFAAIQEESGISPGSLAEAMGRLAARDGNHPLFELETGRISEHRFLESLGAELGRTLGRTVQLHGFSRSYFANLHPNQAMIGCMRSLRERGLRMAILTNNVREWEPLWRAKLPELDEIFEVVVDSAFVGLRKPQPEIFELTLERLGDGLRAEDCAFVDDLEPNCATARALGMTAVRFETAEQAIAELESALARQG